MTLKDYILSYEENGEVVVNLFDYYEKYICKLDKEYQRYSYKKDNMVLCFFKDHNDINPSMGYIRHKKFPKVRVCHCFGCGRTTDVVRTHQILRKQYEDVELTEDEACKELANMFGVSLEEFDTLSDSDYEEIYLNKLRTIDKLYKHYTIREYQQELRDARRNRIVDLNKINSACVRMIATKKQLYD